MHLIKKSQLKKVTRTQEEEERRSTWVIVKQAEEKKDTAWERHCYFQVYWAQYEQGFKELCKDLAGHELLL